PMLRHDLGRNQPDDEHNAQWHNDHIVQIAENRHEVGNQVNRRERIASNADSKRLGVPRYTRIPRRQIDRVHISFDRTCPLSRFPNHRATLVWTAATVDGPPSRLLGGPAPYAGSGAVAVGDDLSILAIMLLLR